MARPIDKGSYMVLESPIPFAFFEIFAENVHAAIDVSIDKASVRRAVQASLDTLSAELWDIVEYFTSTEDKITLTTRYPDDNIIDTLYRRYHLFDKRK